MLGLGRDAANRVAPLLDPKPPKNGCDVCAQPIHNADAAESFPVEPFNTLSSLGFLLLVVYRARRVYRALTQQRLLSWALPVRFIGFVGGTKYHGTRGWPVARPRRKHPLYARARLRY